MSSGPNSAVFDPKLPAPANPELVSLQQEVRHITLIEALSDEASS
jgi:hypothetical protein